MEVPVDYTLTELLSAAPDEIFFNDLGDPNFNAIFVEVARLIYREDTDDFTIPSRDFLTGRLPNLTTFQRSVTQERKKRGG
jgi:hypothetical protein